MILLLASKKIALTAIALITPREYNMGNFTLIEHKPCQPSTSVFINNYKINKNNSISYIDKNGEQIIIFDAEVLLESRN